MVAVYNDYVNGRSLAVLKVYLFLNVTHNIEINHRFFIGYKCFLGSFEIISVTLSCHLSE